MRRPLQRDRPSSLVVCLSTRSENVSHKAHARFLRPLEKQMRSSPTRERCRAPPPASARSSNCCWQPAPRGGDEAGGRGHGPGTPGRGDGASPTHVVRTIEVAEALSLLQVMRGEPWSSADDGGGGAWSGPRRAPASRSLSRPRCYHCPSGVGVGRISGSEKSRLAS